MMWRRALATCLALSLPALVVAEPGAGAGAVQAARGGETIERVLAIVAGDVITLSDVSGARAFGLVVDHGSADPIRDALTQLIDRALILDEVERYAPPEADEATVTRRIDAVRRRFPSDSAFDQALAHAGFDSGRLRELTRQDIRMGVYLDQRFTIPPSGDEEVNRYFAEHRGDFMRNGQFLPLEEARDDVMRAVAAAHRATLVDQWVATLRRRAEVVDLYATAR